MARDLATHVWLNDEHGNPVGFGPGDDVPDWAAEMIGDHCYEPADEAPKKATSSRSSK